jgi:hypothetical protein
MNRPNNSLALALFDALFLPLAGALGVVFGVLDLIGGLITNNLDRMGNGTGYLMAGVLAFAIYIFRRRLFYDRHPEYKEEAEEEEE